MVRIQKIYFPSNFQVYNTVPLTIVDMLYIPSPGFIHFMTRSLHPLTDISLFPLALGNHLGNLLSIFFFFKQNREILFFILQFQVNYKFNCLRCNFHIYTYTHICIFSIRVLLVNQNTIQS